MLQIIRASPACWKTIQVAIEGGWGPTLRLISIFAVIAACIFLPQVVLFLPKHILPESVGCFRNPNGAGYICPS